MLSQDRASRSAGAATIGRGEHRGGCFPRRSAQRGRRLVEHVEGCLHGRDAPARKAM